MNTKFDLFQRLKSGGSIATPQEVRNCAVIMVDEHFFRTLDDLSKDANFSKVSRITEAGAIRQKKLEFVIRFFAFTKFGFDPKYDVEEFVDKHIVEFADQKDEQDKLAEIFTQTFKLLHDAAGKNALRRYDRQFKKFTGGVGQVALEAVAVGVARNYRQSSRKRTPRALCWLK